MTKSYYRSAKACLIVYDITRRETFENVRVWAEQYSQSNPSGKQFVLILGNKKDLVRERQVKYDEGVQLAQEIGCQFHEVSAKDGGEEIEKIMYELTEGLLTQDDEKEPKKADEKKSEKKVKLTGNANGSKKNDSCCL